MRSIPLIVAASFMLPAAAAAQELTGTLRKIKETGTITLGARETSVPFSYLDDKQQLVGYAIDICLKVVDAVKKELDLPALRVSMVPATSSTRIPLMVNGTIDLECGPTTNNVDRQKQVGFTNTYFLTTGKFVSKTASRISSVDDLKGKTVVSTSGSTNIRQLLDVNIQRKLGLNVLTAKDVAEAFLLVETDRAVAFVMDDVLLASLVASAKDPGAYTISTDTLSMPEPYTLMLRREDAPFKAVVDRATAELYRSADGAALYSRWFTQPIPPRNLNMNLPMAPILSRAFQSPSDNADPKHYSN